MIDIFRFYKKDRVVTGDAASGDLANAFGRRATAVKTLVDARTNRGFYAMTQAVFDAGYDSVGFDETVAKYLDYFKGKTYLTEEEIRSCLRDIYDAGVENRRTDEKVEAFKGRLKGDG